MPTAASSQPDASSSMGPAAPHTTGVIPVNSVSYEVFLLVLLFLYSGQVSIVPQKHEHRPNCRQRGCWCVHCTTAVDLAFAGHHTALAEPVRAAVAWRHTALVDQIRAPTGPVVIHLHWQTARGRLHLLPPLVPGCHYRSGFPTPAARLSTQLAFRSTAHGNLVPLSAAMVLVSNLSSP
ncbi:hypothetical protein MLD38_018682 [Melastoma candidum]|uniref:Uncharacterized protein n=1 Tax=Melastoma candidum TaxID=119954 RepID=A0ACB9QUR6_9MYRT|nr:hypothetical protein MLD38_018682 [Melastoma candidum]